MATDLAKEIVEALEEYSSEVEETLEKSKVKIAKETVTELKSISPKRKKGGNYAKGWGTQKQGTAIVVRNKTRYQLTHLLENGHVNRDGGRTQGIPHISIAESHAVTNFEKQVESELKK